MLFSDLSCQLWFHLSCRVAIFILTVCYQNFLLLGLKFSLFCSKWSQFSGEELLCSYGLSFPWADLFVYVHVHIGFYRPHCMCMKIRGEGQDSLGYLSLLSTFLWLVPVCFVTEWICKSSWPTDLQEFFCLCLPSWCSNAVIITHLVLMCSGN